jgi:hypothetical protein
MSSFHPRTTVMTINQVGITALLATVDRLASTKNPSVSLRNLSVIICDLDGGIITNEFLSKSLN